MGKGGPFPMHPFQQKDPYNWSVFKGTILRSTCSARQEFVSFQKYVGRLEALKLPKEAVANKK